MTAAKDLTTSLNTASDAVNTVRKDADSSIADSVSTVNDLLQQFSIANAAVMRAPHRAATSPTRRTSGTRS